MPKVWKIKPSLSDDLIQDLLLSRGFKTIKEQEQFFHPNLADFANELDIPGIIKAKKRIEQAIKNQEQIFVYGDYDADGICSTAVIYHALSSIGAKILPYIPHREKEGYGLSLEGLKTIKEKGASLVITVDNGIVAIKQAKEAQKMGLDLIITDHHLPQDVLPEATAIVHSTQMCGAAVAWCLIRQMVEEKLALELLDLVAIATICDLVSLTGINRALVKIGLSELNQTKKVGLLALIIEAGLEVDKVTAYQVGHLLGPRLNAIGRLEHAIEGLRLLCTKDIEKARGLAKRICEANDQKKRLTSDAIFQAKDLVNQSNTRLTDKILVLHSENWIPGIIGLVAGRIAEEYKIPSVVISQGQTLSKGSARSSNGLNIVEVLRKCSDLLVDIGGHPGAAGFTIETSKISLFKERLISVVSREEIKVEEVLEIEAEVNPKKVTKKLIADLEQFEPTGINNQKPVFASLNCPVSSIRTVGSGQHLKFKTSGLDAIAFSFGSLSEMLKEGQYINIAYYLEL